MKLKCVQSFSFKESVNGEKVEETVRVKEGSIWETESTLADLNYYGFIEELTLSEPNEGDWLNYVDRATIQKKFEVLEN